MKHNKPNKGIIEQIQENGKSYQETKMTMVLLDDIIKQLKKEPLPKGYWKSLTEYVEYLPEKFKNKVNKDSNK